MPEVIDTRGNGLDENPASDLIAAEQDFTQSQADRIVLELARLAKAVEGLEEKLDGLHVFCEEHLYMAAGGSLAEMQNSYTNRVASIGRQVMNAQAEQARIVPTGETPQA